jgi:hypothetical protein
MVPSAFAFAAILEYKREQERSSEERVKRDVWKEPGSNRELQVWAIARII